MSQHHQRGGSSSRTTQRFEDEDLMINSQTRCSQSQDGGRNDPYTDSQRDPFWDRAAYTDSQDDPDTDGQGSGGSSTNDDDSDGTTDGGTDADEAPPPDGESARPKKLQKSRKRNTVGTVNSCSHQ
jgi:hypothetical protein